MAGDFVSGVVGGLFGGSVGKATSPLSSGSNASDSWNQRPMSIGSYAATTAAAQSAQVAWQTALSGLIGTYSLVKNYELQKRVVDLQERSVNQAEEYLTLSKRHYNEISVPAFTRSRKHYDYVIKYWRPKLASFVTEGMRLKTYTPDYDTQMGRFMSVTQAEFAKARRLRRRQRGRFEVGRSCFENALFSIRAAEAKVAAASAGFRYEDLKRVEMDKWYWSRWKDAADLMGSALANAISGLNQGVATATSGLNAVGNSVDRSRNAINGLAGVTGEMRDWWGTQSNDAFTHMRARQQMGPMTGNATPQSTVAPTILSAIGNGAQNGVASFITGLTGGLGTTSYIGQRNSGEGPI